MHRAQQRLRSGLCHVSVQAACEAAHQAVSEQLHLDPTPQTYWLLHAPLGKQHTLSALTLSVCRPEAASPWAVGGLAAGHDAAPALVQPGLCPGRSGCARRCGDKWAPALGQRRWLDGQLRLACFGCRRLVMPIHLQHKGEHLLLQNDWSGESAPCSAKHEHKQLTSSSPQCLKRDLSACLSSQRVR